MACDKISRFYLFWSEIWNSIKDRGKEWFKFSCYEAAEVDKSEKSLRTSVTTGTTSLAAFHMEQMRRKWKWALVLGFWPTGLPP